MDYFLAYKSMILVRKTRNDSVVLDMCTQHVMEATNNSVVFDMCTQHVMEATNLISFMFLVKSTWEVIESTSAIQAARYGHTSVYDDFSKRIYVYGGASIDKNDKLLPVDSLMAYYPYNRTWYVYKTLKNVSSAV